MEKFTLERWRQIIAEQVDSLDIAPYSHNIISNALRGIDKSFGREKAIQTIEDFELRNYGWKIPDDKG